MGDRTIGTPLRQWLSRVAFLLLLTACASDLRSGVKYRQIPAAQAFHFYPIRWQDDLILPVRNKQGACIQSLPIAGGAPNWIICDPAFCRIYYNFSPYVSQDHLVLPIGRATFCLNPRTGVMLWQDRQAGPGDAHLFGEGEYAYRSFFHPPDSTYSVLQFRLADGTSRVLFTLPKVVNGQTLFRSPVPYRHQGTTWLLSPVISFAPKGKTRSFLLTWPKADTAKLIRWPAFPGREPAQGEGVTLPPVLEYPRSYWTAMENAFCLDLQTQTECWRTPLPRELLTSCLSSFGDQLFLATEDEKLYALSKSSGEILSVAKLAGTPSRIHHTANRIWVIGGSDGRLHVLARDSLRKMEEYAFAHTSRPLKRSSYIDEDVLVLSDGQIWHIVPADSLNRYLTAVLD